MEQMNEWLKRTLNALRQTMCGKETCLGVILSIMEWNSIKFTSRPDFSHPPQHLIRFKLINMVMRVSLCGSMVFMGVLCVCRWYLVRFAVGDQREVLLLCLRHDSAGKLLLLWPCLTLSACPWIWNQTRHGEHLALLYFFRYLLLFGVVVVALKSS